MQPAKFPQDGHFGAHRCCSACIQEYVVRKVQEGELDIPCFLRCENYILSYELIRELLEDTDVFDMYVLL